jgi:uncharacterized protein (TIGR02722 family)
MKTIVVCVMMVIISVIFTGCRTATTRVDIYNDPSGPIAALDYRDVQEAANASLKSLLGSGRLNRADGGVYVMTVGKIKNDTMQRNFDTDTLTSHITEELMNSGKIMVTSAMAYSEDNRDEMIQAARSVRGNSEFNQATVVKTGQLVAPTHSISGKIIQREIRMDNGDKQIEYYFQLRITELATGLQWWQKQYPIVKRTDASTPTW